MIERQEISAATQIPESRTGPAAPVAPARGCGSAAENWCRNQVTQQICSHHRRRLGKIGWEQALDVSSGGWAATDSAPRRGNNVDVMIDGAQALPAIADQMRQAQSRIHVTQPLEPLEPAVRATVGNVGRRLKVATKHLG